MSQTQALVELLMMLLLQPRVALLVLLLLVAALIDWRSMRIPNWLTAGGAVLGLLMSMLMPPSPHLGVSDALGGLALGLLLMLPMYLLGVMGAGDVKLMAMAGTYLGVPHTLHAVLFVFITGGVAALGLVLMRRAWLGLARNLKNLLLMALVAPEAVVRPRGLLATLPSVGKLPYGVSICAGTVAYLVSHQLGWV